MSGIARERRSQLECTELGCVQHDAAVITAEEAERVVGWAFSEYLSSGAPLPTLPAEGAEARLAINADSFKAAFEIHGALKVCSAQLLAYLWGQATYQSRVRPV